LFTFKGTFEQNLEVGTWNLFSVLQAEFRNSSGTALAALD
jgi:hypothetical protein